MVKLIGIGHRSKMGKGTFALMLMSALKDLNAFHAYHETGFSDTLKEVCHIMWGWAGVRSRAYYEKHPKAKDDFIEALGMTVREVWIKFGTKVIREQWHDDTWVEASLEKALRKTKEGERHLIIFSDMRAPNEAEVLRREDGILIKVYREQVEPIVSSLDPLLDDFDDWDYIVNNSGSFDELRADANKIARVLVKLWGIETM